MAGQGTAYTTTSNGNEPRFSAYVTQKTPKTKAVASEFRGSVNSSDRATAIVLPPSFIQTYQRG
jgi:hypothetical protein